MKFARLIVERRTSADYAADFEEIMLDESIEAFVDYEIATGETDHADRRDRIEEGYRTTEKTYEGPLARARFQDALSLLSEACAWPESVPPPTLKSTCVVLIPMDHLNGAVFRTPSGRPLVLLDQGLTGFYSVAMQLMQRFLDEPWFETPLLVRSQEECTMALQEWCRMIATGTIEDPACAEIISEAMISIECARYCEEVERFVLCHELGHILNGDHDSCFTAQESGEVVGAKEAEQLADRVALEAILATGRGGESHARSTLAVGTFMLALEIVEGHLREASQPEDPAHPTASQRIKALSALGHPEALRTLGLLRRQILAVRS